MASGYLHHSAARVALNGGAVFLMAFALTVSAQAVADDAQWQTEPRFYLAGVTGYVEEDGASYNFDALAIAAELKISHFARRWYASVFAEYHISGDDGFDDIINVGTYWKYNRQSWDATTSSIIRPKILLLAAARSPMAKAFMWCTNPSARRP